MSQGIPSYGGQAVIEGVMFGGKHVNVTAVRRKNQEITFLEVPRSEKSWVVKLRKIPLLRGLVSIIDASAKGSKHLNYSAEAYAEDETETEEIAKQNKKKEKEEGWSLGMMLGVAVMGILSFIVGKIIFTLVPVFVEHYLFGNAFKNYVLHNLIEGAIKLVLLLVYLWAISQTPVVKRLFQYHGAEHKVISAFEAGDELTVENVQKHSRLHYRCGSSFMMLTIVLGVIIYSVVPWDTLVERIVQRLILLPLVIGVSFEVLKGTNAVRELPVLRFLGYPGLWLQLLTTKEPKDDQVEVSIASFNRMRELDAAIEAKGYQQSSVTGGILDPAKG
ncbi:membrane protein [Paenibacillus durus]|uniref:Membrane protein n=2 Tax=Paenibacillus durus TaxID=44251 RepID=A0A089IXJ7_PAEDU|nr:membrane protein [Paenibacillus durus]